MPDNKPEQGKKSGISIIEVGGRDQSIESERAKFAKIFGRIENFHMKEYQKIKSEGAE